MPKPFLTLSIFLFWITASFAQSPQPSTILLWPNGAPGAQGTADEDRPSLTIYLAAGNKVPTGVVVCPGGGYVHLALDHEGTQIAAWLNQLGISAFVLKYRLGPKYHHPIELGDGQRAVRYVRAHASEYGIDSHRIGIWGFSAGGHLASSVGTHFDGGNRDSADPVEHESSRPDFMILAYPVISFTTDNVHKGSRENLLGKEYDPKLAELLSNEKQITPETPPTFLFHTDADPTVPVENSVLFYLGLRKAHVPAEMHIFEKGRHGVGLAQTDPALSEWGTLLANWFRTRGLIPAASK